MFYFRRELEYRRHSSLPLHLGAENETWGSRYVTRSRHIARHLGRSPETWRRSFRRNTATAPPDTSQSTTPSTPSAPTENRDREQREPVRRASTTTVGKPLCYKLPTNKYLCYGPGKCCRPCEVIL